MITSLLVTAALSMQAPDDGVFRTQAAAPVDGAAARTVVAADVRQITCLEALRELSQAMNWNLVVASTPLENDLRFASVDLNFASQDPRTVAQLVAVAGGADALFDEPADFEGARVTLHVTRVPSAETESGRQRLRALAGQWYRSFLQDELEFEPLVQDEGVQVRMHLGELLVESGELESAIGFFQSVYEQEPKEHLVPALLKIAACHLDLAAGHVDREERRLDYRQAKRWVSRVFQGRRTTAEDAAATVLQGRATLGLARSAATESAAQQQARECENDLYGRLVDLDDTAQVLDVRLLRAEAQMLLGRPDKVYETMRKVRQSPFFTQLDARRSRDYRYLLGYGALGTGDPDLAMRAFEWFLIHAEDDERCGAAYVMLAEAYFAEGRFLEGRAAAIAARRRYLPQLAETWRERALKVWARTGLALGHKEEAFLELEQLVLRGEEPELALFLMDALITDRQWQRAMAVGRGYLEREDRFGDEARVRLVQALYAQARAGGHLADFPAQAIAWAPKVRDEALRRQIATMIGEAYTALELLEHAADAFRGILR
ncbi:MAG: tetratricopeptide repeat protein [Planctomycetota bacterium]